jgi:hypothetical protein
MPQAAAPGRHAHIPAEPQAGLSICGAQLIGVQFQPDAFEECVRILRLAAVQPREEPKVFPCGQLQIVVRRLERDADPAVVASISKSLFDADAVRRTALTAATGSIRDACRDLPQVTRTHRVSRW